MDSFPTQKGRTLPNVHAGPFEKGLFAAIFPSRPVWLAHKQFGVPEVTYYGYSSIRVLRVFVQNPLCSSAGSCLSKVPSNSCFRPSLDFMFYIPSHTAYSGTARGLSTIFTLLCFPCSYCILAGDRLNGDKKIKPGTICREAQCTSANMFVCKWYVLQKTFPLIPGGSFTLMFAQRILSLKMHQMNKKKWLKSNFTTAKIHKVKINITVFPFV